MARVDQPARDSVSRQAPSFVPLPADFIDTTIPDRFRSIINKYPDRFAVIGRDVSLTYSELNQESDRLCHLISERCGGGPGAIALLLPQGATAVVAILGALKAGKYYVPLDCETPAHWLREALSETQPAIVLTDDRNLSLANSISPDDSLAYAFRPEYEGHYSSPSEFHEQTPDDIACIFYTSGTTGEPKGVFDTHRNVLHNIMRYTNSLSICARDRLSLLQSPAFSGSVSSLFCALLNGATVYPIDMKQESNGGLTAWVQKHKITIFHSVPAVFRRLTIGTQQFPSIRVVRLEGDRSSKQDFARFLQHFPSESLMVNGLGTTETGIVSQFFMDPRTMWEGDTLPVGYPCQDIDIRVISDDGQEMPIGQFGEISVTSRYLASGYWQRSDLTEAAFVTSSADQKMRTYRTGDLGRIADNGILEHLGRVDSKIRLHGNWILPAVVEEFLTEIPEIDAAVVSLTGSSEHKRLVAYIVCCLARELDIREVRTQLRKNLPDYSVPSRFVFLESIPVTVNGKVDRSSLPEPDFARPNLSVPYVSRKSVLHQQLIDLWCEVLELDQVGIKDDFLDLGGDSIRAMHMLVGLEEILGFRIAPDTLLEKSTIEELSDVLLREPDVSRTVRAFNANGTKPSMFFFHGDYLSGGIYTRRLASHLGSDQPLVPISPCAFVENSIPTSYSDMAEIHLEQIRSIQPKGPYRLGGVCNGGLVAYEVSQHLAQKGEDVERLVLVDASVSNLRFRWLHDNLAIRTFSAINPALAQGVFLFLRGFLDLFAKHHGLDRAKLILHRITDRMGLHLEEAAKQVLSSDSVIFDNLKLSNHYQMIDRLYFPSPNDGRLIVLWPRQNVNEELEVVRYWWKMLCPRVVVREIEGDSVTSLTRYSNTLAAEIQAVLAD